jgi:hypothetical protein
LSLIFKNFCKIKTKKREGFYSWKGDLTTVNQISKMSFNYLLISKVFLRNLHKTWSTAIFWTHLLLKEETIISIDKEHRWYMVANLLKELLKIVQNFSIIKITIFCKRMKWRLYFWCWKICLNHSQE